jgi:hypothetical protein
VLQAISANEEAEVKIRISHSASKDSSSQPISKVLEVLWQCWRVVAEIFEFPQCKMVSTLDALSGHCYKIIGNNALKPTMTDQERYAVISGVIRIAEVHLKMLSLQKHAFSPSIHYLFTLLGEGAL